MAKVKNFNISDFVEESSSNAIPQKNYDRNSETSPSTVQNAQPENAMKTSEEKKEESKGQRGRRKSLRTIPRQNGKVVFLEVEADAALARISVLQRVDKQDIIRTALDAFLAQHYDGMNLDAKGSQMLTDYIQKTTQME